MSHDPQVMGIIKKGEQHGQDRTTRPCGVEEPERDLGPVE